MDAHLQPARRARREISTEDMAVGQAPNIILPNDGPIAREAEEIALADTPLVDGYAELLAFNEQMVTIMLQPSSEKFAPQLIDVYVNGRAEWIPVGKPWKIARKYVEVLARAKPDSVQTEAVEVQGDEMTRNIVHRYTSAKHPFSVIHDPDRRGIEWLSRIISER